MPAVRLGLQTRAEIGGRHYVLSRSLGDGVLQFEAEDDGQIRRMDRTELAQLISHGSARIIVPETQPAGAGKALTRADLTALPQREQDAVLRRCAYVQAVQRPELPLQGKALVQAIIPIVADRLGDQSPPTWQTVYAWRKLLAEGGGDAGALIPNIRRRGNRRAKIPPEVREVIERVLNERFLVTTRPRIADILSAIEVDIRRMNLGRPSTDHLPIPSARTVYRAVKKIDRYALIEGRFGKRLADLDARHIGPGVRTSRPLERIEIDHTKLDVMVCDDLYGMPIGRPWMTMVLDHYSRMPLGFYLGFIPPSTTSVMLALRASIRTKEWVREKHPEVEKDWPCFGVPEVLVTDNGPEFHSKALQLACYQLMIDIQHTRVKAPWTKGVVERLFGEINRSVLAHVPGRTFHNTTARADNRPQNEAVISLTLLEKITCKWIVDVHGAKPHTGINDIPLDRWKAGVERVPMAFVPDAASLDVLLAPGKEDATLHPQGIRMLDLWYSSEWLTGLRLRSQGRTAVQYKFDPLCLSHIHVLDPETERYVPVPAVDFDYASSVGLWQHQVVRRLIRDKMVDRFDRASLAEAREQIFAMIQQARRTRRGAGAKAARFLEGTNPPETRPVIAASLDRPVLDLPSGPETNWLYDDDDDEIVVTHDMNRVQRARR